MLSQSCASHMTSFIQIWDTVMIMYTKKIEQEWRHTHFVKLMHNRLLNVLTKKYRHLK